MGFSREEILSNSFPKGCFEKNHILFSLTVANPVRKVSRFSVICISMTTNEDDYLFLYYLPFWICSF